MVVAAPHTLGDSHQYEQRALPAHYLLWWWAELQGPVSRSSAEPECRWPSWGWVLGWRRAGLADSDWSAGRMWVWPDPLRLGWSCWPCQPVNQDISYTLTLCISEPEVRGQHLEVVTCFSGCSRDRLLFFDWRGLEHGQGTEASPRGYQRGPQGGLTVGAGTWVTVWSTGRRMWCAFFTFLSCNEEKPTKWGTSNPLWLGRRCPDWPDQWPADLLLLWTASPNR